MHGGSDKNRLSGPPLAAEGAIEGPGAAGPGADQGQAMFPRGDGDTDDDAWACAARPGGYAWWYADVSDGRYTLTVILFAGAVFSPDYAARVRRGAGDGGLDHPAVNVVLFEGDRPLAWVMSEHRPGAGGLERLPGGLRVAGSSLGREGDGAVRIRLDERTTRFFSMAGPALAGEVRLAPGPRATVLPALRLSAEAAEDHFWRPRLLGGTADVDLRIGGRPLRFTGAAYHDGNFGAGRLERAFSRWSWAHGTDARAGRAVVLYEVAWRGGGGRGLLLDEDGGVRVVPGPSPGTAAAAGPAVPGPRWLRVPSAFRVGDWRCARQPGALLDAPFYARYRARLERDGGGAAYEGVGEYLDLERFSSRGIQFLLRFKTRRVPSPRGTGGAGGA
jgi:hypothetical protein